MVRSPKAEMLFKIAKSSRGFKESDDASFFKSQELLLNRFPAARMASSKTVDPFIEKPILNANLFPERFFSAKNDISCFTFSRVFSLNLGERFN